MIRFIKQASACVLVIGCCCTPVSAQAAPIERIIDSDTGLPTPVAGYGGVAVWSSYDPSTRRYTLRAWHNGITERLPVASRTVSFDADVGPDAHGDAVVVYSHCRREPTTSASFSSYPSWSFARDCDVYEYRFSSRRARRLRVASSPARSEFLPSIWRSQLAFFVTQPSGGHRSIVARLSIGSVVHGGKRRTSPGVPKVLVSSSAEPSSTGHHRCRWIFAATPRRTPGAI